ncbi:MAG: HD domain-containing protein [Deltaproteobacteria bacterium]|nr:HD domain-containing protein [Deltaproteobacteria bacterium]
MELEKRIFVKDIRPGQAVNDLFLVMEKNMAVSQKGNPYLSLRLRDSSGEMEGRVWENAEALSKTFDRGDIILIRSRAVSYKNMTQLSITDLSVPESTAIEPADYFPTTRSDRREMFEMLLTYIDRMSNPHLKALLERIFKDPETVRAFMNVPAAKGFHHSYIGGLLEHTLSVTQLLETFADHYPGTDRDLILAGGMLHDIGKIKEISYARVIDYTDEGRLIGHIILGFELVNEKMAGLPDFPEELALQLRHIMLSHHGDLAYGSPKRPKTVEALIVNHIDDLDAKVNAFRESIDDANEESNWTRYHRLLERFIYKGRP